MRRDIHAVIEIEAVSRESLHAGIQGEVFAALFPGMFDEPIEKGRAISARTVGIVGNEIINVERAAGEKEIEDAKARHRTNDTIQFEKGKLIAFLLLLQHPRGEVDGLDVRTQFSHDGATAPDLFGDLRESNFPCRRFLDGHGISSSARG